jgi:hypothetical protein
VSNGFRNTITIPPVEKEGQVLTSTISGVTWETPPGQILRSSWKYTTKVNPDVAGDITLNAGTWAAATQVKMNKISAGGVDVTTVISTFQVGDTLYIQDSADASKWGKYSITGPFSNQGSWGYFPVTYIESSGALPANNSGVLMLAEVGAGGGGGTSISDSTPTSLIGLLVGNGTDVDALPVIDDAHLPSRLQTAGPPITDFNAVNMSGWYRPNNATNGPPGGTPYGMLLHDAWDTANGHAFQIFNAMNDNTLWWRACMTYVWQAWKKISPIDSTNLPVLGDANLPDRLKSTAVYIGDLNVQPSGWCDWSPATTGRPTDGYGVAFTIVLDTAQTQQFAWQYNTGIGWIRQKRDNAWLGWTQTWPLTAAVVPVNDTNLPPRLRQSTSQNAVADANACLLDGWYFLPSAGQTNTPYATDWYMMVMSHGNSGGLLKQFLYNYYGDEFWERTNLGAWQKLFPIDGSNLPARLKDFSSEPADLNSVVVNGWSYANTCANRPPSGVSQWFVQTISWGSAGWAKQIAYALGATPGEIWQRLYASSAYQAWEKIWPLSTAQVPITDANLPIRLRSDSGSASPVSDANSANASGFYYLLPNAANKPPGNDMHLVVSAYNTGYLEQTAVDLHVDRIYTRRCDAGSWTAWVKTFPIDDENLPVRLRSSSYYGGGGSNVSDCNSAIASGWYSVNGGSNAPTNFYGYANYANLYVSSSDTASDSNISQILVPYWADFVFMRRRHQGTWQPWVQMFPVVAAVPARLGDNCNFVDDWNQAITNGFYMNSSGTNGPAGGVWTKGVVTAHNPSWTEQEVHCFTDGSHPQRRYRRFQNNGSWGAWNAVDLPRVDISLDNWWIAQGGGWEYPTASVHAGLVSLEGRVYHHENGGDPWAGINIGWVPAGYRIPRAQFFGPRCWGGQAEIALYTDGSIILNAWSGDPKQMTNLSGITYRLWA